MDGAVIPVVAFVFVNYVSRTFVVFIRSFTIELQAAAATHAEAREELEVQTAQLAAANDELRAQHAETLRGLAAEKEGLEGAKRGLEGRVQELEGRVERERARAAGLEAAAAEAGGKVERLRAEGSAQVCSYGLFCLICMVLRASCGAFGFRITCIHKLESTRPRTPGREAAGVGGGGGGAAGGFARE